MVECDLAKIEVMGSNPMPRSNAMKLTTFLYLLMRDTVPTGEVARIVKEIESSLDQEPCFTNKHLASYAEEIAKKLED